MSESESIGYSNSYFSDELDDGLEKTVENPGLEKEAVGVCVDLTNSPIPVKNAKTWASMNKKDSLGFVQESKQAAIPEPLELSDSEDSDGFLDKTFVVTSDRRAKKVGEADTNGSRSGSQNGEPKGMSQMSEEENVGSSTDSNYENQTASQNGQRNVVNCVLEEEKVGSSTDSNYENQTASQNGQRNVVNCVLEEENVDTSTESNYENQSASLYGEPTVVNRQLAEEREDRTGDSNDSFSPVPLDLAETFTLSQSSTMDSLRDRESSTTIGAPGAISKRKLKTKRKTPVPEIGSSASAMTAKRMKESKKLARSKERVIVKVVNGDYCYEEIDVYIENSLYEKKGNLLSQSLREFGFQSINAKACAIPGAIWFSRTPWRHDRIDHGMNCPLPNIAGKYTPNMLTIWWDGSEFASLLNKTSFPTVVDRLKSTFEFLESQRSREKVPFEKRMISFVVEGLDQAMCNIQHNHIQKCRRNSPSRSSSMVSSIAVNEVTTWLYLTAKVHVRFADSEQATISEIVKLSKESARRPYAKQVDLIDLAPKYKILNNEYDNVDDPSGILAARTALQETWINQLRCIPGMSEACARRIAAKYPTFHSLYSQYCSPEKSRKEKENLLASVAGGGTRQLLRLSITVFQVFTSLDGAENPKPDKVRGSKATSQSRNQRRKVP